MKWNPLYMKDGTYVDFRIVCSGQPAVEGVLEKYKTLIRGMLVGAFRSHRYHS